MTCKTQNRHLTQYLLYLDLEIIQFLWINNSVVRGIGVPNYSNALKEQSAHVFNKQIYSLVLFHH